MMLLDAYIPVFKHILLITCDPKQYDNYNNSRQSCIEKLELAMNYAGELDICEEEKMLAQVAVIAWVDETLLRSSVQWRQRWQSELLQRKYLNLTVAGERFFTLLAQLDPTYEQARPVFLFCLQQGFRGRYNTDEDQTSLLEEIVKQRQLCLPEEWQTWPNGAEITPNIANKSSSAPIYQRLLLTFSAAVILLYGALFFFLHHYTS